MIKVTEILGMQRHLCSVVEKNGCGYVYIMVNIIFSILPATKIIIETGWKYDD